MKMTGVADTKKNNMNLKMKDVTVPLVQCL